MRDLGNHRLVQFVRNSSRWLVSLGRSEKRLVQVVVDFVGTVSVVLALGVFDSAVPLSALVLLATATGCMAIWMMNRRGVYRAWVRYLAPQIGLEVFAIAASLVMLIMAMHRLALSSWPDGATALDLLCLLFLVLIGPRLMTRALFIWAGEQDREHVLIYGAGAAGRELAAALRAGSLFHVTTFLDDDRSLHGSSVMNIPVRGPEYLPQALENGVTRVLLAMPRLSLSRRREIVERIGEYRVAVQTIPSFPDLVQGQAAVDQLRDLSALDLLGRDVVPPIRELVEHDVRNRVVLITGAGGSIGSELARQVQAQQASKLILLDHSELALYEIERELRQAPVASGCEIRAVLGTVLDQAAMTALMRNMEVETVYHAAAYKHVPIVEDNVCAGVRNNVMGTWAMGCAAAEAGVESFVLVSTDKAVRPTNIMGATKRAAELAIQALSKVHARTRFSIVRFGNVLDSSGSVVPLFRQQIAQGGPVTVTHRDVIRYFMTIPEAAQLVIQAGAMGRKAEVFVLDMGDPVRIYDLALRMIHLAGLEERTEESTQGDIAIEFVGLRPGEKLYEELLVQGNEQTTRHPRIRQADEPSLSLVEFSNLLERVQYALGRGDQDDVRDALLRFPVQYQACESHRAASESALAGQSV